MGPFQTRNVIDSNSNGLKSSVKSWYFFLLQQCSSCRSGAFYHRKMQCWSRHLDFPVKKWMSEHCGTTRWESWKPLWKSKVINYQSCNKYNCIQNNLCSAPDTSWQMGFFIHLNLLISMSSMQSASHPIFLLWEEPQTRGTQWISATPTRRFARCFQAFTHSSIPVVLLHPCLDLWTLHIVESVREMWLKRHGVLWFYFSSPWTFTSALESLKSTPTLTAAVLPHRCPGGISAK